jgi:predicted nucleotidyltransferase
MKVGGVDWINALPPELARQQQLLRKVLALCNADSAIRWLVIGCSLARSAADSLSDLDLAMGITDQDFAAALPRLRHAIDNLGDLVESYHHQLPSVAETHERIFAQFADRCQIDLMIFPASAPGGSIPDVVVLYDPDDRLVIRDKRQPVTPEQIRSWAFRGWCALADLGKYLRRGSAWEALDRLNEARAQLWQLWAVTVKVPDPAYGLTSILDFAPDQLPAAFQDTVSDLDPARLLHAA